MEQIEQQIPANEKITVERVETIFGARNTAHLKASTEYMISAIDRALEGTRLLSIELGQAMKQIYPKAKIIKIAE